MSSISSRIFTIISEQLGIGEDEIALESSFMDDLGADSLDIVEVVMMIEEEFGMEIPDDQVEELETVSSLIKYVEKQVH